MKQHLIMTMQITNILLKRNNAFSCVNSMPQHRSICQEKTTKPATKLSSQIIVVILLHGYIHYELFPCMIKSSPQPSWKLDKQ